MKKQLFTLLAAAMLASPPLFALRPGDRALEAGKLKMLRGDRIVLGPGTKDHPQPLRAAVFLLCRAVNSGSTLAMLNELQRTYGGRLRIAVITPDAASDAEALLKSVGDCAVALGLDPERKLTKEYMAGAVLYPMAFLIDGSGVILWCGEAVDMAEKIRPALEGKISSSDEARIFALVADMQQLLRDNSETKMRRNADRVFAIEPGNAAAMRIRLFTLENTGRIAQARELIDSQLKAAPKLARLYFTAADFAARYGASDAELERILAAFERNIADAETRVRMGWMLLERFPYQPSALNASVRFLRGPLPGASLPRANAAAGRALLEYRLGNLHEALEFQREAVKELNRAGSAEALERAKQREVYYRSVLKLKGAAEK